jgi:hypothetical protein
MEIANFSKSWEESFINIFYQTHCPSNSIVDGRTISPVQTSWQKWLQQISCWVYQIQLYAKNIYEKKH